jgi:hypothetical protein
VFHDFGAHPIRGANLGAVAGVGVHAFSGYSEVCQFGYAFAVEKYVGGLYVAMYLFVGVEVNEAFEHGLQNTGNFVLVQSLLRDIDEIYDAACVAVLKHNPQIIILEVGAVVFHNVLVVAELQNLYLLLDRIDFR